MTTIQIKYFAALREQAGKSGEEFRTAAQTTGELYESLCRQYDFSLGVDQVKVAVNQEYRTMDHVLSGGDEVVFIPPVSGG